MASASSWTSVPGCRRRPTLTRFAQSIQPASRVVYADKRPDGAIPTLAPLLASGPQGVIACVEADLRDTDTILTQAAGILDLTRPAAILLLAVLDHVSDLDEARRILARLLAAVPPGSFVVISHAASDIDPEETSEMISRLNEHLAKASFRRRPRDAGRAVLRRPRPGGTRSGHDHPVAPAVGG